jgi:uncharacterized protein (TIGR02145 family)
MNKVKLTLLTAISIAMAFAFLACEDKKSKKAEAVMAEEAEEPHEIQYGSPLTYEGQTYKIVKIGSQTWMAENLNFKTGNSWCYDNADSNCAKYGRLYTWEAAMKACPSGWHLPNNREWLELMEAAGGRLVYESDDARSEYYIADLKSKTGWEKEEVGNGTDNFGFSALPGGLRRADGSFDWIGRSSYWWTGGGGKAGSWNYYNFFMESAWGYFDGQENNEGVSVRCIANKCGDKEYDIATQFCLHSGEGSIVNRCGGKEYNSEWQFCHSGKVFDKCDGKEYNSETHFCDSRESKIYKRVKIGKQVWMAENLNYDAEGSIEKHGRLYSWETAMDRDICPDGWHLPTNKEWTALIEAAGGSNAAGIGANANWWCAADEVQHQYRYVNINNKNNGACSSVSDKKGMFNVRCVMGKAEKPVGRPPLEWVDEKNSEYIRQAAIVASEAFADPLPYMFTISDGNFSKFDGLIDDNDKHGYGESFKILFKQAYSQRDKYLSGWLQSFIKRVASLIPREEYMNNWDYMVRQLLIAHDDLSARKDGFSEIYAYLEEESVSNALYLYEGILPFVRDKKRLEEAGIATATVVWTYSFWGRRYNENPDNIKPIVATLRMLRDEL